MTGRWRNGRWQVDWLIPNLGQTSGDLSGACGLDPVGWSILPCAMMKLIKLIFASDNKHHHYSGIQDMQVAQAVLTNQGSSCMCGLAVFFVRPMAMQCNALHQHLIAVVCFWRFIWFQRCHTTYSTCMRGIRRSSSPSHPLRHPTTSPTTSMECIAWKTTASWRCGSGQPLRPFRRFRCLGRKSRSDGLARGVSYVAAGGSVHPFHPATKFRGHGGGDVVPIVWGSAGCLQGLI